MVRFCITIAYDGQPFAGWQSQPGGQTVQDTIEAALTAIVKTGASDVSARVRVHGSGRTDAGVHAIGQVAHFDAPDGASLDAAAWQRALNARLPPTIRISACRQVASQFHARFDASRKTYTYRIYHGDVLPPHEAGRAWHVHGDLDYARIEQGLAAITGRHDFSGFAANRGDASDAAPRERTIFDAQLAIDGTLLTLHFCGDGFLYRMVRLLTGGVVRCAQHRAPMDWFTNILQHPDATAKCSFCAPAAGLYLTHVSY